MFEFKCWNLWHLIAHNILIAEILKIPNLRFSAPIWVILCLPYFNMNAWNAMNELITFRCNTTTLHLILHSLPYSSQRDVFLPVLSTAERGLSQKGPDQIHAALNFTKSSNLRSNLIVLDHIAENNVNLNRILSLILK